jgi:hypothetical protein
VTEQKALNGHLVAFKDNLKAIIPIREQQKQHQIQFKNFLENYETTRNGKSNEVGELAHVSLFSGAGNNLLDKLTMAANEQTNPLVHVAHWVKSEVWCLEALQQAIAEKDALDNKKRNAQQEIVSLTEEINKLNAGKFSLKSMFKNDSEKKTTAVEKGNVKKQYEMDVQNYDVLKKYLIIYLATKAIPNYKTQRTQAYIRAMGRMSDAEVRNAENTFDCWTNFQNKIKTYNIKY